MLPVVLIEDDFSRWMPEETDLDKYGIVATGCVTRYFGVVVLDPDIAGAFPEIGELVSLYLGTNYANHTHAFDSPKYGPIQCRCGVPRQRF
jgi:hypothetical protein